MGVSVRCARSRPVNRRSVCRPARAIEFCRRRSWKTASGLSWNSRPSISTSTHVPSDRRQPRSPRAIPALSRPMATCKDGAGSPASKHCSRAPVSKGDWARPSTRGHHECRLAAPRRPRTARRTSRSSSGVMRERLSMESGTATTVSRGHSGSAWIRAVGRSALGWSPAQTVRIGEACWRTRTSPPRVNIVRMAE